MQANAISELPIDLSPGRRARHLLRDNLTALRQRDATLAGELEAWIEAGRDITEPGSVAQGRVETRELVQAIQDGRAVAMMGVSDGAILVELAESLVDFPLGRRQAVYVIEPNPGALISAMLSRPMLQVFAHDCIRLFVGESAMSRFEQMLTQNPCAPVPGTLVTSVAEQHSTMVEQLQSLVYREAKRLIQRTRSSQAHYACTRAADIAAVLQGKAARPPRVLLITTRFSTVLQHSTRESARAFEALGFDVELLIESECWHSITQMSIVEAIDRFKPDMVFQIDHLRHERGDAIDPNLPFVCWVQDHLPNLTSIEAGSKIGKRDFVMSATPSVYVDKYRYPKQQMIPIHKLSSDIEVPAHFEQDGDDLVYVSTAARTPERIVEANMSVFQAGPALCDLFRRCQRRLIQVYESGGCLHTPLELAQLVDDTAGSKLPDDARDAIIRLLVHPLNDALYRQQALTWVADIADEMGLSLALYGKDWDQHPRFKRYDRGWIAYGPELERLTRRSKINLQITPNCCLHQRLLDGLIAGGFFLIREHTSDRLLPMIAKFLTDHLPPDAIDTESALRLVRASQRNELVGLLDASRKLSVLGEAIDPIAQVRAGIEARTFDANMQLLPEIQQVMFDSPDALQRLITKFIKNRSERDAIQRQQRQSIRERKTYQAGMRQLVDAMVQRLEMEAA